MVRDSDSATEARSIVGCRSCRASPRRSRRFARAASVASRLEVFRSTRTPVAVIGRSLVAFPRPYTRSPSAMRIVRRRRRTRHRAIASRAFAREKVMRRRKTATATNTHLLGCHGGCHSTLAVRSLHVRVLLLSVRQDVARPSARRGMIFTGSNWARTTSQQCSSLSRSESAAAAALHSTRWWRRAPNFFNFRAPSSFPGQFSWRPPADRSPREGPSVPINHGADARRVQLRCHGAPTPPRLLRVTARISLFVRHRQPRDLTSPPTRRRRAGTQTHERDAQRRRELHARRRAEPDRGVRPPASRTHHPPDASTTPDRRRVRKSAAARRWPRRWPRCRIFGSFFARVSRLVSSLV